MSSTLGISNPGSFINDCPPHASVPGSRCSAIFVVNSDFTAVTGVAASSDYKNIAGIRAGTIANASNIIPTTNNPAATHLVLALAIYQPLGAEAILTVPKLCCFGLLPGAMSGREKWPDDVLPLLEIPAPSGLFPVPLRAEGALYNDMDIIHAVTLQGIVAASGLKTLSITDLIRVPTRGCREILTTVRVPGTVDAGAYGMVLGFYASESI